MRPQSSTPAIVRQPISRTSRSRSGHHFGWHAHVCANCKRARRVYRSDAYACALARSLSRQTFNMWLSIFIRLTTHLKSPCTYSYPWASVRACVCVSHMRAHRPDKHYRFACGPEPGASTQTQCTEKKHEPPLISAPSCGRIEHTHTLTRICKCFPPTCTCARVCGCAASRTIS